MSTPRGYWWEATYHPTETPVQELDLVTVRMQEDQPNAGHNTAHTKFLIKPVSESTKKFVEYVFDTCDFIKAAHYEKVNFQNCKFKKCRFDNNAVFDSVKFSGCTFEQCHFGYAHFQNCIFHDCKFEKNTANADYLNFSRCSIAATAFLHGITTNLQYVKVNDGETKEDRVNYQLYRLKKSIAKIAQMILISTQQEPDQDLYFDAHKQTTLRWIAWKVIRAKYHKEKADGRIPPKKSRWLYWPMSAVSALDYLITFLSGFFTNWGRSIARPALFFVAMVSIFSCVYAHYINSWCVGPDAVVAQSLRGAEPVLLTLQRAPVQKNERSTVPNLTPQCANYSHMDAILRAADVSIVAGYTKYSFQSDGSTADSRDRGLRYLSFLNMIIGLYWYGLVIPVILRRIIRS